MKPTLELLAGMPTIVYGYLALLLVTPILKRMLEPLGFRVETFNALSACIVVGVMIIPLVSSLSEDVLSAVPRGLREAAFGLGATKFEVSTRVVLPAALSGVFASFILAVSRAVGETMAVVLAAGMRPQITLNPLTQIETMTTYIVQVIGGEAAFGEPKYLSLFAVGLTLFAITLTLNIISGVVLRHFQRGLSMSGLANGTRSVPATWCFGASERSIKVPPRSLRREARFARKLGSPESAASAAARPDLRDGVPAGDLHGRRGADTAAGLDRGGGATGAA